MLGWRDGALNLTRMYTVILKPNLGRSLLVRLVLNQVEPVLSHSEAYSHRSMTKLAGLDLN